MRIEVYKKRLFWRVRLIDANGEPVLVSEAYFNKSNAERAAKRVRETLRAA
jgi:uncharacterized protein YegP (UPF0339 family)